MSTPIDQMHNSELQALLKRLVEHDEKSRNYPVRTAAKPVTKRWTHYGAILNQKQVGSCVGHTIAQGSNCDPLHDKGKLYYNRDALRLYARATELDDLPGTYPQEDSGSSGLGGAKAAQEAGMIGVYTHAFGAAQALPAIPLGVGYLGINWYWDMFNPDSKGFVWPTGGVAGGHELVVTAVNFEEKWVALLNHWTKSWGVGGYARVTFDVFYRLLAEDGDIIFPQRPAPFAPSSASA